ncbi:MAG: carbohydrate binding family 9 domain-containing protein [Melioribacteraceae bacterium]|nr:carbohydrate binding family 9 domain-containing protein [Melioribacteraceae bacterium]
MRFLISLVISTLLILPTLSAKSKGSSKSVNAFKLSNTINFDGLLTEAIWNKPSSNSFTQRDPEEGEPATEQTEVWVAYDEESIYIAARLYDSQPDKIDASLARRDSWHDSDWFTFYIDPYLDRKTGYYFSVNAGGSIRDGVYYNDSWSTDSWDGIWHAQTAVDDDGWSVEIKIPFLNYGLIIQRK